MNQDKPLFIVTGATGGIGRATSVALALEGKALVLACRNVNTAAIFLCARYVFPLFFLPALAALISTLAVEPMFKPYLPQEMQ